MNHVFLSYRHESDDHAKAVWDLGEKLKVAGLPVELDQFCVEGYPDGPDEGWRKWCENRAEKSACVLIVCSKGWFDCYMKEGTPSNGLGAALEAAVFSGEIYDEKGRNARVRLVNLDNFSEAGIPQRLKDCHIFRLFSSVSEFNQMTKWIRQRLAMPGSSVSPPKVVFLAECAFDMQKEREKLKSFLQEKGWQVRPTSQYDLAGREMALQADLLESVAFIQLLESYPRETGFDRQQREAANSKPRFLFRDENVRLDEADAQHREFLMQPDVITGSFDDFQLNVAKELNELWEQQKPAPIKEPAPDSPGDLLNVLTSGEFPKQAELRAINLAPAKAERNPVDCTVFASARVERKQAGLLQVFLHAPEDRKQAEAAAEKFDPESKERGHRSLVLDAPIGTTFAFDVEIEGFLFPERMDTLIWTGHPQSATFRFEVPEDCKWGQHTGTVRISIDGAPVGRISFQIEVVRDASDARNRPVGKEARHYHACFFSYSSLDRDEMLKRAQGLAGGRFGDVYRRAETSTG
jgi:hypothetical protein